MDRKPRVYVSRVIPEPGMSLLQENLDVTVNKVDGPPSREELLKQTRDVDGVLILLTEKIDEEFLGNAKNLKVVSSYSVGLDHIDVAACTRHRILVTNTPDVLTDATADLAFALLLSAARRLPEGERLIRDWSVPWSPFLLVGQDVSGATLGIVGFGRIGQAVAKRANGFGMRVFYFDRKGQIEKLGVDLKEARYLPLEELLRVSDFVSVHLPLTPETRHLFGAEQFSTMKKTAVFINTSRGGLVDQPALVEALKNKTIFSAGLDVFEKEPISRDDPLLKLENVALAPHLGSASVRARSGMAELAATNLIDGLGGRIPRAAVNKELLAALR